MGDAWVSVGLERHLRGSGASPWRSMCISLSFCAPQPSFWPFLPHSTHYWELPKKTGGQVAEISLHHLFCKWLSRALGEVLRLCFGMKSPNMEHTAPYGQPASSIMLMPRFSQQPFLTEDTQGVLLPKWAPPQACRQTTAAWIWEWEVCHQQLCSAREVLYCRMWLWPWIWRCFSAAGIA